MSQNRKDIHRHRRIAQKRSLALSGAPARESLRERFHGMSAGLTMLSRTPKAMAEMLAEDARVQQARFEQLEESLLASLVMPQLEPIPIPESTDEVPEIQDS